MGLLEVARLKRNPEVKKANPLVVEKAMKLWDVIAPGTRPTPELPTAIYSFNYELRQRYSIDERNIPGVSRNLKIFDSNLRPYWETEEDIFKVTLRINPNYFNHRKVGKGIQSFEFHVDALNPSDGEYITVFGFTEYVQNESFGLFKKHRKQEIYIYAESKKYSGDLSMLIVERPIHPRETRFITKEQAETSAEAIMPDNIAWRNRFATEILDHFIHTVGGPLDLRKSRDKEYQERSARQGI